jgi:hypothetical protein
VASLFCEFVSGYTGRNPDRRGRGTGDEPLWSMLELQELLDEWLIAAFTIRWIVSTFSDLLLLIDYMSTTENAGCCRYFWRVAGRTVGDLVGHAGMAAGRRARAGRKQQPGLTERLVPR